MNLLVGGGAYGRNVTSAAKPPPGTGCAAYGGGVGGGDGADDGQAEAMAAIAAGWARAEPLPHPRGITLR